MASDPHPLRNGGHSGIGGRRPGAGRKPDFLKRLGIKAITAAEILARVNEPEIWYGLLHHKSPDVRLRTLTYLIDRRDGKPKQAVDVSGGIMHAAHTTQESQLAALSPEELHKPTRKPRTTRPRCPAKIKNRIKHNHRRSTGGVRRHERVSSASW
jgi:hypothetical protein